MPLRDNLSRLAGAAAHVTEALTRPSSQPSHPDGSSLRTEQQQQFRRLRKRCLACREALTPLLPRLTAHKQLAIRNELVREAEQLIHGAFHRDGGMAFYAGEFIRFAEALPGQEVAVQELWLGGYSSALRMFRQQMAALEEKLAELRRSLTALPVRYSAPADVLRTVGYEDCAPLLRETQAVLADPSSPPDNRRSLLTRLEQLTASNEAALPEARKCWETAPALRELSNAPLLLALRAVVADPVLEALACPDLLPARDYRREMTDYAAQLKRRLAPFALHNTTEGGNSHD